MAIKLTMAMTFICLASPVISAESTPEIVRLIADPPDHSTRHASQWLAPNQRKIALSLRGGSAKGLAHIGVLQRFEEEGIPLGGITGTSAGAFVAALYASGFSGPNMAKVFRVMDLGTLLDDRRRSTGISLSEEELRSANFLSVDFQNGELDLLPGRERTRKVQRVLRTAFSGTFLTVGNDFDRLRIPIRIVATDLQTGEPHIFRSGFLADAVQASMTIPGLLVPLTINGHQLIDGGLVDNFPIATSNVEFPGMLQVGVDISRKWDTSRVSSILRLFNRSLDSSMRQNERHSIKHADLLISPSMDKAQEFDFQGQVDSLIASGREAFDQCLPRLEELMYGPESDRFVATWPMQLLDSPDPALSGLIQKSLPSGNQFRLRDLYRFLRRLYVTLPVADAWIELPPSPTGSPQLHIRYQPKIKQVNLRLPETLTPVERLRYQNGVTRQGLRVGDRFSPSAMDACLAEFSLYGAIPGSAFVRFSKSSFNESDGCLSIIGMTTSLQNIEILPKDSNQPLQDYLKNFIGQPIRPADMLERMDSAKVHFGYSDIVGEPYISDGGMQIKLYPRRDSNLNLSLAPAYESTWGAHLGIGGILQNPFSIPMYLGFQGSVNSLQTRYVFFANRESTSLPGFGIVSYLNASRQQFDQDLFLVEKPPRGFSDLQVRHQAFGFGPWKRFSNTDRGLIGLTMEERRSSYSGALGVSPRMIDQTIQLSAEWDNLDFHLLPSEGAVLRLRYGQSFHVEGIPDPFRFAYVRARYLNPIPSLPFGLDLDSETVLGWHTPITRWNTMGGGGSIIGTRSAAYLLPNASIFRIGLPFTSANIFGVGVQAVPRFDWGRFSLEPKDLGSGPRIFGIGMTVASIIRSFNVELSFGQTQIRGGSQSGTRKGSEFALLVGTRPFDLWKHM